jgi:hypothetical protein
MAASICTASRLALPWAYSVVSTRLTTPLVTETASPPMGYLQRGGRGDESSL